MELATRFVIAVAAATMNVSSAFAQATVPAQSNEIQEIRLGGPDGQDAARNIDFAALNKQLSVKVKPRPRMANPGVDTTEMEKVMANKLYFVRAWMGVSPR